VILIAVAFLVFGGLIPLPGAATPSPTVPITEVVVVGQPINQNDQITEASLSTIKLPKNFVTEKMVTDKQLVIGKYAKTALSQGLPISLDMVVDRPPSGNTKSILPGQVAISMPIDELNLVGYAVKDGDYVDVIATTLFVDLDASFQSVLPNHLGEVTGPGGGGGEGGSIVAGGTGPFGRMELEPTLNQVIYTVPSEPQRPRLVSQMILQNIQVLHVGLFPLTAEAPPQATPDAAAQGGQPAPTPVPQPKPTMITLIVSPQDAVSLTYLLSTQVKLALVLRAPDDSSRAETEAATLQYLLSQYAIPVPAKLPYGIEPRLDKLSPGTTGAAAPTPRP
jgi:pilus assembly protein CpaB